MTVMVVMSQNPRGDLLSRTAQRRTLIVPRDGTNPDNSIETSPDQGIVQSTRVSDTDREDAGLGIDLPARDGLVGGNTMLHNAGSCAREQEQSEGF